MAIALIQQPTPLYPAYNDCFLKFTTTFSNPSHAVITVGGYTFTIYPDLGGDYLFNLKNVVTAIINPEQFRDNLQYIDDGIPSNDWWRSDHRLIKEINVDITAYGDGMESTTSATYSFTKAVKQYGDKDYDNPVQLMLPSEDGYNYHLTYFEGYPIDFTFRQLQKDDQIKIINHRTGQESQLYTALNTRPYRYTLDNGMENVHTRGELDIPDMVNRMNILRIVDENVDEKYAITLNIKKIPAKCGVYLKWFNADGSYSYWLFNQFYRQDYEGKEIDVIGNNNGFKNIYNNNQGTTRYNGKEGERELKLTTTVDKWEKEHLVSLVTSPLVQMWSSKEAFSEGEWIDVKVTSNGFTYNAKNDYNKIGFTIQLPEVNTQFI